MRMPSQAGQREAWSRSVPLGTGSRCGDRLDIVKAQRLLLTRAESARALSMSLSHFQRHVQPEVPCVRSGRLRLYRPLDLERWLESATAGPICDPSLGDLTLEGVVERFIRAARESVALNKWRRPYRPRAVEDLKSLHQLPQGVLGCHIDAVTLGDVQGLIDELSEEGRSASRIGSIVNALRALYRFARERELTSNDPARNVRLPLVLRTAHHRVTTPAEFHLLLKTLWERTPEEIENDRWRDPREALGDALPYALAAYGTARAQEIEVLDWRHVNLAGGAIELAGDEDGRKPGGSWRVVPLVEPLRALLGGEWVAQGRPPSGRVCPPKRVSKSSRRSMRSLQRRVRGRWQAQGLEPIGLHEARHTAATWLDHAGVSAKVCSQIMGHKTPEYQPGAARITLERYTHVLPGELEHAREGLIDSSANARKPGAESGASAPTLGSYDWALLAEQVAATPWSIAAREAGVWALERLREEFGPRWPPAWKEPGGMPAEIASCFWALAGLSGTISLALAFERLRGADGLEHLRKSIKRGTDQGRFASLRLQVQQAALAKSIGLDVAIEPLIPGAETKADLAIRGEGVELVVEAFAVLRDKHTMDASAWLDGAREGLRRIGEQFRVDFKGTVETPLNDEETACGWRRCGVMPSCMPKACRCRRFKWAALSSLLRRGIPAEAVASRCRRSHTASAWGCACRRRPSKPGARALNGC